MSAIGRVFALLSAGCAGLGCGLWLERRASAPSPGPPGHPGPFSPGPFSPGPSPSPGPFSPGPSPSPGSFSPGPSPSPGSGPPGSPAAGSPMLRQGLPSDDRVRHFDGFVASLNYERRVPNWVLEHLPAAAEEAAESRDGVRFFADPGVPEAFRVQPEDYSSVARFPEARGLSRGHLAAAQFHKGAAEEMAQTFNMNANIVPQDMTMNAVDWLRLENLTRRARRWYEEGVWVVSGPVFMPRKFYGSPRVAPAAPLIPAKDKDSSSSHSAPSVRKVVCYELVGKHDVAVPTHLFKVILGEKADGTHEIAAFLMPNGPITEEKPLTEYQVPVETIERATGLQFFPLAAAAAKSGRRWGMDRMPNMCARHSCEVRTMPLFQGLRGVARLRAAQSVPELQQAYKEIVGEHGDGKSGKVDNAVKKEFTERMRELAGATVNEVG